MLLRIEPESDIPIYVQIRKQIVSGVAAGELVAGEQLPSVRRLAMDLGVNLHTVNKAYAMLQSEGYVSMNGRRGAVVAEPPAWDDGFLDGLSDALGEILTEAKARRVPYGVISARVYESLRDYPVADGADGHADAGDVSVGGRSGCTGENDEKGVC
ncbi:MAG: GntR family transcriptional regulator [Clostridiales Family XIII bacterium]|jgi:DNA-binding transcriptional regulator YhcF (GntR family)|nr:GntR family transcriptional regulator [Clostridiales Family XIII bacterium]